MTNILIGMDKDLLKVLIVEDDKVFTLQLEAFLYKLNYKQVKAVATYDEAIAYLQTHHVDLIIIDIHLSVKRTGIELAEQIVHWSIPILFITSQDNKEFYERASAIPLSTYLVKSFHAFTLDSTIRLLLHKTQNDIFLRLESSKGGLIKLADILYIEVENTYSFVHTTHKKTAYKKSLTQLMTLIPMQYFLQIHRRYIVQKRYIQNVDLYASTVTLSNDLVLPISRRMKQEIKKNLKNE